MLPLTADTHGILNRSLFAQLAPGASLINVGRGEHLVDADLLQALDTGQLSSATLDVFRQEPLPTDSPLWQHPKVLVTPHVASMIDPLSGGERIAQNLKNFRAGVAVDDLVDPGRGY
jgi:glyoxylate/hydroxypyruvate reductase A